MDLWVVAAAAGAGYIAKYLHKSKEGEGLGESVLEESSVKSNSRPFFEQLLDNNCSVQRLDRRRLRVKSGIEDDNMPSSSGGKFLGASKSDRFVVDSEVASTSGVDHEMPVIYESIEDSNVLSLSSLSGRFNGKINYQEYEEDRIRGNSDITDKSSLRSKSDFRKKNRRGYSVKPFSSLDSCLRAQLYNEHVEEEEYMFSPFSSPSRSSPRPLLVTDGSRIISRASRDAFSLQYHLYKEDGLDSDVKETIMGVPPLPEVGPMQFSKKPKQKRGKELYGRLSSSNRKVPDKQFHSQGTPDRMFIFCLGITFGVMSTVMANKREVDKLNELLKQTENLVQDLHEELEMKDSLTVKELANEGDESQATNDHSFAYQSLTPFSSTMEVNESSEHGNKRPEDQKSGENSESRSKIEAELEAELERLELNMSASCLERRLAGFVELDVESVPDIVQGELRINTGNGGAACQKESDRDSSGTSTTQTENVNYAVSPRELSLRLHEVIQSRLEERIKELETALENSNTKLQSVESKQINSWMNYSNSEAGSSSQESPIMRQEEINTMEQPLFLNLSDDALDAYNEAYEALNSRISGMDEESPSYAACKSSEFKEEMEKSDCSPAVLSEVIEIHEETDDEDDDVMARLLIKQLVEKTRQGSPAVLNAQRMLFSMDEKTRFQ